MKKAGKIILILLGVIIVLLSVRALLGMPERQEILASAVWLDEPVCLPENEGSMVIISGEPEMLSPAYDEELGLTLNTIKAYRYDEEYRQTSGEKNIRKYKWVSCGAGSIAGEAALGEFILDEKTINAFTTDAEYSDFDPAEISAGGYGIGYGKTAEDAMTDRLWVIKGGEYYYDAFEYSNSKDIPHITRSINAEIAGEREGARAYAYRVCTGKPGAQVTIAGIQQGNMLLAHDEIGSVVRAGKLTRDELVKAEKGSLMGGSIAFLVIGLALVFLGLRKPQKNNRKQKRAEK